MWLIITAVAALAVTAIYITTTRKYRLGMLSMVLWALTACIFVDHALGWLLEGGEFFDIGAESLILSIVMLIPIFAVWGLVLIRDKFTSAKAEVRTTAQED